MKTLTFFKFTFIFAALALMLTSCSKETTNESLEGTWDITEFLADGEDVLTTEYGENASGTLSFVSTGELIGNMTFTISSDTYSYGQTIEYVLNEEGTIITIDDDPANLDVDGKNLTITATEDGESTVIRAEKR